MLKAEGSSAAVPTAQWSLGRLALALPALLAVGVLAWPAAARWAYDDPYITYRYAENLLGGLGFVYNPGLRVQSTTTPGYTLLLAALGLFWPNLPLLSNGLGLLAILLSGLVVVALLPTTLGRLGGALLALLGALLTPPYYALGSEMPLYTLLVLLAVLAAYRESALLAGALAGATTVMRPDGALLVVVILACFSRRPGLLLQALAGAALVAGPWYLFALSYFGSPIPATLGTKQAQLREIAGSTTFLQRLGGMLAAYGRLPWFWPAIACAAWGLLTLARERRLPLLLAWAALYIAGYTALGVSAYHWYIVPLFPALLYLVGYGLADLTARQAGPPSWARHMLVVAVLALPLAGATLGLQSTLRRSPEARALAYSEVGKWLATNSSPGSSVGAFEVGIIGYHSRRAMVDFAGLIQPEVAASSGGSYADWAAAAVGRYQPDMLVLPLPLTNTPWLAAYRPLRVFAVAGYPDRLVVYGRR